MGAEVYKFIGMLNGHSYVTRIFTTILKPAYANLRQRGYLSAVFANELYFQGDTEIECLGNVEATTALFKYLGFNIQEKKLVLRRTQRIGFLDLLIDSTKMTFTISNGKMIAITNKIQTYN